MLKLFSPRKAVLATASPPDSPTSASEFSKADSTVGSELTPSGLAKRVVVKGEDISEWPEVTIEAPPGPLGILLDSSCIVAAVIEEFATVSTSGARGAIEMSGRVPVGSVLVGVNARDFLAEGSTLAEIGLALRETSQVTRSLHFKVSPSYSPRRKLTLETLMTSEPASDKEKLLGGSSSSSEETNPAAKKRGVGGVRSPSVNTLMSPLNSPTVQSAPVEHDQASSFMSVTGMETAAPATSVTAQGLPGHRVSVKVPAGPIGVNLDGDIVDHAVVIGYLPLPDGSRGALERHGGITRGSVLVEINGEDVSTLSLAAIREKLGASARAPRRLVFHVLAKPLDTTSEPAAAVDRHPSRRRLSYSSQSSSVEDLLQRRRLELTLVMKHDRASLKFKECWFMVDAAWMRNWALFVGRGGAPPGPISNHVLLADGWRHRIAGTAAGRPDAVRAGLQLSKDYRCVTPMVWSLLTALHGEGEAPVLARYALEINSEPISTREVDAILRDARPQAAALAASLREKCQVELLEVPDSSDRAN